MPNTYHTIPVLEDTSFSVFLDGEIKAQRRMSHTIQDKVIRSFEILRNKSTQKFPDSMLAPPNALMHNKSVGRPCLATCSETGKNSLFQ